MGAYQLVSLGFIGGFGVGGLFMLWLWMRARPEDFKRSAISTGDDERETEE